MQTYLREDPQLEVMYRISVNVSPLYLAVPGFEKSKRFLSGDQRYQINYSQNEIQNYPPVKILRSLSFQTSPPIFKQMGSSVHNFFLRTPTL